MPRIRSVHPGIWTDEAFASVSDSALLFYIGLLTDADDHGIFEWKPFSLKVRLRPGKDGPVEPLLAELEAVDAIRKVEIDGHELGAIRNFGRYQRPKYPKYRHTITPEIGNYVSSSGSIPEIDGDDDPPLPEPKKPKRKTKEMNGVDSGKVVSEGAKEEEEGAKEEAEKKEHSSEANASSSPPPKFAFEGKVIRVTVADLEKWRTTYHAVPDIIAELETADAFYVANPKRKDKPFFRASSWLKKAHTDALKAAQPTQPKTDEELLREYGRRI